MRNYFALAVVLGCNIGLVSAKDYFSGEIRTREPFQYGKFKTRLSGCGQKGTVTSFFTFWNGQEDLPWSVSEWEEIDIELIPTLEEWTLNTNLIYREMRMDGEGVPNSEFGDEWHEYEIVWKPSYIAFSLDGVEVRRETSSNEAVRDMNKFSLLYMNFWTPEWDSWGRGLDDSTMPWYARYDYVEAYDWDESTDTFNLRFRDDFNTLDRSIWRVSDPWTFDDNSSLFVDEHTYVQDGNLVLKMDKYRHDPMPNPSPGPSPTPNPSQCVLDYQALRYGDKCDSRRHDLSNCTNCLDSCYQSWSSVDADGWDSLDAFCRCLPQQAALTAYSYGTVSNDAKAGLCGENCQECRWSWPADDKLKWKSEHLMARCMPAGVTPYDPANDS